MNDFEIWQRFSVFDRVHPQLQMTRQLFVPAIEPVGDLPYELDYYDYMRGLAHSEAGDDDAAGPYMP